MGEHERVCENHLEKMKRLFFLGAAHRVFSRRRMSCLLKVIFVSHSTIPEKNEGLLVVYFSIKLLARRVSCGHPILGENDESFNNNDCYLWGDMPPGHPLFKFWLKTCSASTVFGEL